LEPILLSRFAAGKKIKVLEDKLRKTWVLIKKKEKRENKSIGK